MVSNNPLDNITDGYGHDRDMPAELPDPLAALQPYREPEPRWLGLVNRFSRATLDQFLDNRVAFYPGAGKDGQLFSLFGKSRSVHCFVHADFDQPAEGILAILQGKDEDRISGYDPVNPQVKGPDWLQSFESPPEYDQESRPGTSLFTVLKKRLEVPVDHGPEYLCFLHVSVDAYWLYWNLWGRHETTPFAILLHDHGFGGNYPDHCFGGAENTLYQMANQAGLPEWLLVAKDNESWPGYEVASDWSQGGQSMHNTKRRLYRRRE